MIFHSQQLKTNIGVSLIKEVKDLCNENTGKSNRKILIDVNPFHAFELIELML